VTDELSPEEFERLERELSLGRRDWAVRMHAHRAGDSLQYALALTRGAAAATKGSTAPCRPSEFQVTPPTTEVVWWSCLPEEMLVARHDIVERNRPEKNTLREGEGSTCLTR
jgi:hypothetical protein